MPVVPMLRNGPGPAQGVTRPPPDPVYGLMAATQMHSEGRLLANNYQEQVNQWDAEDLKIPKPHRNTPPVENFPTTGPMSAGPAMNT